ncbi:2-octaprenyl-6-methoxyphenyl hydroxylase [Beggiatoa leptomitoformis]|uniref:2-octaprenyl-6-methoxyphenyl hydroxylase n=1 Tax=Beggiatoa leptomitoformis TaxID=288004 RepID=A0A2N9YHL9_9GAMM|nr:2-octaprenyl-6-methoxyphenyl hydroxylase [Beggiatoa leptomitoformis]ALG68000.1 2-octaprenyl-6-methoxyphenyl hydroxylase [Beggiatoa leptomitoformis]AUI69716.1 2-octaprenyl-6-methoxyphenyl hydroxylase [Beggiatoa leptomitoformis]
MTTLYDLVIIGGGLVGTSLACALRHTPLKIALVEANEWITTSGKSHYDDRVLALTHTSQRILQGLQVWQTIAPAITPIQQIHVSEQGGFGMTRLNAKTAQLPALGYTIRAKQLSQALQQAVSQTSQTVFAPAQVTQVCFNEQYIELQLQHQAQTQLLQTRLLVIAEGGQSKIRDYVGIEAHESAYGQTAITCNVTLSQAHHHIAYERFTPTGPLALLPLENRDCSLIWTVSSDDTVRALALNDADFLQVIQQAFGWRAGQFIHTGQRVAYPLRLVRTESSDYPRLTVIGNAAHTLHPIAGQGFNLGLRDVASLAQAIIETLQAGNVDIGDITTLDCYQQYQQPDQNRVTTLTNQMVKVFSNDFFPLQVARNLGILTVDAIPLLKQIVIQQMTGLNGHPSRLLMGMPLTM